MARKPSRRRASASSSSSSRRRRERSRRAKSSALARTSSRPGSWAPPCSRIGVRARLFFPLDGAAHRRDLLLRSLAGFGDLFHGLEHLVEAAVVLELERSVEAEELRRAHRIVAARDVLRLVDHIGKRKALLPRHALHVLERVLGIVGRVVRHHRNRPDAERRERLAVPHDAVDYALHVRAVVTDEHHQQTLVAADALRRVTLAVDAGKLERRCLHAKIVTWHRAFTSMRRCAPAACARFPRTRRTTRSTCCVCVRARRSPSSTAAGASSRRASCPFSGSRSRSTSSTTARSSANRHYA